MVTIVWLPAITVLNVSYCTLEIKMSESAYKESLEMHEWWGRFWWVLADLLYDSGEDLCIFMAY